MGLFDLAGQLVKTTVRVATLPVSVVKDTVTLGGLITGEESATIEHLSKIVDDLTEIPDSIIE